MSESKITSSQITNITLGSGIKITTKNQENKLGTFGFGFSSNNEGFTSERFQGLLTRFDFIAPEYPKGGFAQFSPTDADYTEMEHLNKYLCSPEYAYSEV